MLVRNDTCVELAPAEAGLLASRRADCNKTESNLKSGAFVDTEGVSLSHMANEHGVARAFIRIVESHEYSPAKRLIRSLISSAVRGVGLAKPGTLSWTSEGLLGVGLTCHQGNVSGSVRSPQSHAVGCCCISVRCRCAAAEGKKVKSCALVLVNVLLTAELVCRPAWLICTKAAVLFLVAAAAYFLSAAFISSLGGLSMICKSRSRAGQASPLPEAGKSCPYAWHCSRGRRGNG